MIQEYESDPDTHSVSGEYQAYLRALRLLFQELHQLVLHGNDSSPFDVGESDSLSEHESFPSYTLHLSFQRSLYAPEHPLIVSHAVEEGLPHLSSSPPYSSMLVHVASI